MLALRYRGDASTSENDRFLDLLAERGDGITSLVNVLETCGVLSFNLNRRQLRSLHAYFGRRFAVKVVPERAEGGFVPARLLGPSRTSQMSRVSKGPEEPEP